MTTIHIHIEGIVQGVGFRPCVYTLAKELNLRGWVNNAADGVHIEIQGGPLVCEKFMQRLKANPPELSRITSWKSYEADREVYDSFSILKSDLETRNSVLLTPDYSICHTCESELFDSENRRYRYPFITCTCCGPRYSIIETLPYDRERTTMEEFPMCEKCREEYDNLFDRRYYSQTNSCTECGIRLAYHAENNKIPDDNEAVLHQIKEDLSGGKILAVKGIGGYLLVCDATNRSTVSLLRQRKGRPSKPFAMLYPDESLLEKDVFIHNSALEAYRSVEAPIVLFERKKECTTGIAAEEIAPDLQHLGIMRPSAPLLSLIAHDFGKPLVATSGNLSGSPIIFKDDQARHALTWIADAVISHNRPILIPEDDSVVAFTPESRERIIIRRSRGMAPNFFGPTAPSGPACLSMGASLKSTFALQQENATYISQYLGDQDSFDTQQSYRSTLRHLSRILAFRPDQIIVDKHPHYASSILGRKLAEEEKIPLKEVQHHEAHFAAVLGENDLFNSASEVMGVIWDGTGYGDDDNIWGGEFFSYSNGQISRKAHFDYYNHILGDKMPREPRLSALTILHDTIEEGRLRDYFSPEEWEYYHKILRQGSGLKTSSAGRIFDAAACLLGLGERISYEGEAAIRLESLAAEAQNKVAQALDLKLALSPAYHLLRMLLLRSQGYTLADVAWQFHSGMADVIGYVARKYEIRNLAFSGGVFQNGLLVDLIRDKLENDFTLYFHRELSPNDENISYGQLVYMLNRVGSRSIQETKQVYY